MSRIFKDSSVLNQFGSPSINSNTLANRPAFGQPGRLFVSTDTLAIFRDTGTAWVNLTAGGGTIGTLQQVTTLGSRTNQNIFIGPSLITPSTGVSLDVYGYEVIRNTVDSAAQLGPIFYSQYTINYNGTSLSGFANSIFAQDIYNVSASTTVASSTQSGTSLNINTYKFSTASTITFTQPSGTIRAASALTAYSQFQNTATGTITHAAGITILGVENIGGSALNITDNYQLLINASDEFASTATFTRQWGVYQNGANDINFFRGIIQQGNKSGAWISFEGNSIYGRFGAGYNDLFITSYALTILTNGNYNKITTNGNLVLGSNITDSGRKLQVNGDIEVITTTATGVHTATAQHLPIDVNNTLYYLQLLN